MPNVSLWLEGILLVTSDVEFSFENHWYFKWWNNSCPSQMLTYD